MTNEQRTEQEYFEHERQKRIAAQREFFEKIQDGTVLTDRLILGLDIYGQITKTNFKLFQHLKESLMVELFPLPVNVALRNLSRHLLSFALTKLRLWS